MNEDEGIHPALGVFLGVLLFVGSILLCFVHLSAFIFGLIVAIICLQKGYRSIFIGYILSLGVTLLGIVIYCSNHPFRM